MPRLGPSPASLVLLAALAVASLLALGGCDLFPKTGTEWAVAGGIFLAILIPVVWLAWKGSKGPPKS